MRAVSSLCQNQMARLTGPRPTRPPLLPFADAADFYHATDFAQIVDDPLEVCGAADHDLKEVQRPVVGQSADIGALDIDLDRTDGLAHGGQQAGPVFRQDFDFDCAGEVVGLVPS